MDDFPGMSDVMETPEKVELHHIRPDPPPVAVPVERRADPQPLMPPTFNEWEKRNVIARQYDTTEMLRTCPGCKKGFPQDVLSEYELCEGCRAVLDASVEKSQTAQRCPNCGSGVIHIGIDTHRKYPEFLCCEDCEHQWNMEGSHVQSLTQLRTHDRSMSVEKIAVEVMKILLPSAGFSQTSDAIASRSWQVALDMKLEKAKHEQGLERCRNTPGVKVIGDVVIPNVDDGGDHRALKDVPEEIVTRCRISGALQVEPSSE